MPSLSGCNLQRYALSLYVPRPKTTKVFRYHQSIQEPITSSRPSPSTSAVTMLCAPILRTTGFSHHRPNAMHVPIYRFSTSRHPQPSACGAACRQYKRVFPSKWRPHLITILTRSDFRNGHCAQANPPVYLLSGHAVQYGKIFTPAANTSFLVFHIVSTCCLIATSALPSPLKSYTMKGEYQIPGSIPVPYRMSIGKYRPHSNKRIFYTFFR